MSDYSKPKYHILPWRARGVPMVNSFRDALWESYVVLFFALWVVTMVAVFGALLAGPIFLASKLFGA